MLTRIRYALLAILLMLAPMSFGRPAKASDDPQVAVDVLALMVGTNETEAVLARLVARGKLDIVPSLVLVSRFGHDVPLVLQAIAKLTGEPIQNWKDAMLWQERRSDVVPHSSYRPLKLSVLSSIDERFLRFLGDERSARENMRIRLEEIVWGGVTVDGIPSLDNPTLISAADATYLLDSDLVFGVEINGDARAYPLRIMGWHEMFNEVIGGVPVALAYCTLCGSGILFETLVEGRAKPFVFGSSGFLYRSNKLMFDRETDSLWNQFTGEPVTGPLAMSGVKLKIRPVAITSWADWRKANPATKVLSLETGHQRDYRSGVVYRDYFASPDLMFPTVVRDEITLKRKDYVFGIRTVGAAKAWPLAAFGTSPVINDAVGGTKLVLVGDISTRTVRAYSRGEQTFSKAGSPGLVAGPGGDWTMTEQALVSPTGERLPRVAGHISYWFAWDGYLGLDSELYK